MNIGKEIVGWLTKAFGTYAVLLMTYKNRKENGVTLNSVDCEVTLLAIDGDIAKCQQLIGWFQLAEEIGDLGATNNTINLLRAAEVEFNSYRHDIAELFGVENK